MYAREEIFLASQCPSFPAVQTDLPVGDTGQPLGQMAGTSFSAAEEGCMLPFVTEILRCTWQRLPLSRVTVTFRVGLLESYYAFHLLIPGKSASPHALLCLFVS